MAVSSTVGASKFGMQLTFHNSNTQTDQTKSYNGLNFPDGAGSASARGVRLQAFLYGLSDTSGLVAVVRAMNSGYSIQGTALTASNPVTFIET